MGSLPKSSLISQSGTTGLPDEIQWTFFPSAPVWNKTFHFNFLFEKSGQFSVGFSTFLVHEHHCALHKQTVISKKGLVLFPAPQKMNGMQIKDYMKIIFLVYVYRCMQNKLSEGLWNVLKAYELSLVLLYILF